MSVIFPTSPARVHIHLLPRAAEFISYDIINGFRIKAWMPEGQAKIKTTHRYTNFNNNFYYENCSSCPRASSLYFIGRHPEFSRLVTDDFVYHKAKEIALKEENECNVYFKGYGGQPCPLGKTLTPITSRDITNSVLVMGLNYKDNNSPSGFYNAHLCAGDFDEDGNIVATEKFKMSNVNPGDSTDITIGPVCFGNTISYFPPKNLREFSTLFFSTKFNNDYCPLEKFVEHIDQLDILKKETSNYTLQKKEKFICAGYDALMFINGNKDIQAFYTMLLAGFRPIPEIPHLMIIPLEENTIQKDENLYFGYLTKEDSVGRQWYVTPEGFIIGQLDDSIVKVST